MPDYQSLSRNQYIEQNMRFYSLYWDARTTLPFDEDYVRTFLGDVWDGTVTEDSFVVPQPD